MMRLDVVMFDDLSRAVESHTYDVLDISLSEFLASEIKNYDASKPLYFSVYADGVKIPSDLWPRFSLKSCKSLNIVLEPLGDPFTWVAIVVAIAAAAYSAYLMHKMTAKTGTGTKTGSSIYDVNAQGNQVKLNEVIPEQFGLIKRYPDYIADTHRFYRDNKRVLDLSLSQGVGSFSHTDNGSDMYFGNTPFNLLSDKIKFKVYEPAEPLAENSIDSELGWCWFNSLEISASGKELDTPKQNSDDTELVWCFSDWVAVMDSDTRIFKDKKWTKGDILKILAPAKVYLFGDSMKYRANEWYYMNSDSPSGYETELKEQIETSTSYRANYIWGPYHKSNIHIITAEAAADSEHSTYSLISGNHYNDSNLKYFNYYDNNDFCDVWGTGFINSETYISASNFTQWEAEAFSMSAASWPNSKIFTALWNQITDINTDNQTTNGITVNVKHGYTYAKTNNIKGAYLDAASEFKGTIACWNSAAGYIGSSQFWQRDDTGAYSGPQVQSVKDAWLAVTGFNLFGLYDRIGLVYQNNARPFIKTPHSYQDYDGAVNANRSYYTYAFEMYKKLPQREEGFYKVVDVKDLELNALNACFWVSYSIAPEPYRGNVKQKVKAYVLKRCDISGNVYPDWVCFENSYTCNLGGDIVADDETREEGFNISVFDHVND